MSAIERKRELDAILRDCEKRGWRDRLRAATEDGLEMAGPAEVHAAITSLMAELDVKPPRGAPEQTIPAGVLKAAAYFAEHHPNVTLGRLAQIAGMRKQSFSEWYGSKRFAQAVGHIIAKRLDEAEDK